ncbi:MAG: hypothetical protein ABW292_15255 [Vicinamibacterales bacterium]
MKPLKKEALAVLGLVISPDVGLVISVALLAMIFIAAAMNSIGPGSLVIVDDKDQKFRITRSPENDANPGENKVT